MDRTAIRSRIDRERAASEAKCAKLKQEVEAARQAFNQWERPRVVLLEAIAKLEAESSALERIVTNGECELQQDALAAIGAARGMLGDMFQTSRNKIDRYSTKSERYRLAAIIKARQALDELAVSGEQNIREAVRRIVNSVPPPEWEGFTADEAAPKKYETVSLEV